MNEFGTLLLLGICGVEDVKNKKIHIIWPIVFGTVALAGNLLGNGRPFLSMAAGFLPGMTLLVLSKLTKGGIGFGDGLVLAALGTFLGMTEVVRLFSYAVVLSFFAAVFLLIIMHKKKDYQMPFIPFLAVADFGRLAVDRFVS